MRLVTTVKYLIGLAAFSSVVVCLSGSALAASDTALNTLEQSPSVLTPTQSDESAASSDSTVNSDETSQDDSGNVVPSSNSDEVFVSQTSSTSVTTESAVVGGTNFGVSPDNTSSTVKDTSEKTITTPAAAVGNLANKQDSKIAATTVSESGTSNLDSTATQSAQVDQAVVESQTTTYTHPVAPETVVLGQQRLTIQPMITSRSSVADLATTVPTAPASSTHKSPAPTKSTGLLSALTSGLATTVVPMHVEVVAPMALLWSSDFAPVLTVLLLLMVILSFGAVLRRSGFVNAARSDVAPHQSFFATSLSLGYVTASAGRHNPFLVVSDTKTFSVMFHNAFRKEEMV